MKLKALLVGILAVAAFSSVALASGQKPPTTGLGCKPKVSLIVVGVAAADATANQVSIDVKSGNRFVRALVKANVTGLVVTASTNTKIVTTEGAPVPLTAVDKGDRVLTTFRVCKADVKGATAAQLTALLTTLAPKRIVELG